MFASLRIANVPAILIGLNLMTQMVNPVPAGAGGVPRPEILNLDQLGRQLPKQQLRKQARNLPDPTVIVLRGRQTTVGEIRAQGARRRSTMSAKSQAMANQAKAWFEARHAQFEQQQQARFQADNAEATAEFARVRQVAAIEQEAAEHFSRYQAASPAERAQMDKRAGELLQQLQQLGR